MAIKSIFIAMKQLILFYICMSTLLLSSAVFAEVKLVAVGPDKEIKFGEVFQVDFRLITDEVINVNNIIMSAKYDFVQLEVLRIRKSDAINASQLATPFDEERINFFATNRDSLLLPSGPFDISLFTVDFQMEEFTEGNGTYLSFDQGNYFQEGNSTTLLTGESLRIDFVGVIEPKEFNFGHTNIDSEPKTKDFIISNIRDTKLFIDDISFYPEEATLSMNNQCGKEVAAYSTCIVQVLFNPEETRHYNTTLEVFYRQYGGMKVDTLSILGEGVTLSGDTGEIPQCPIYGIQDNGINNTQFFMIDPITRQVMMLGDEHKKADIEGMSAHPTTGQLYGTSGDKTDQQGYLYLIDKQTGDINSIGATGFNEVDGLAFHPSGVLWGSAVGKGLITINPETAESELIVPFKDEIEDIVFNADGSILYAAQDSHIWSFDGQDLKVVCSNLPNQIEALSIVPGNALMFSFHHDKRNYIHVLDIDTCTVIEEQGLPTGLNDIEGLTWIPSCLTQAP